MIASGCGGGRNIGGTQVNSEAHNPALEERRRAPAEFVTNAPAAAYRAVGCRCRRPRGRYLSSGRIGSRFHTSAMAVLRPMGVLHLPDGASCTSVSNSFEVAAASRLVPTSEGVA